MRSSRKIALLAAPLFAAAAFADLPQWISAFPAGDMLETLFFRTVTFGANTVAWRKPPAETRPALDLAIRQANTASHLYALRARESEALLDIAAAEADWVRFVQAAPNKAEAWIEKANFHQRRAEPPKELAALLEAAKVPADKWDALRAAPSQAAWRALERAAKLAEAQLLPPADALNIWRAWRERYPKDAYPYRTAAAWMLARNRFDDHAALLNLYTQNFPADSAWPLAQQAAAVRRRNQPAAAAQIYDRAFQPDWPDNLFNEFHALLAETATLRAYVERQRTALAANPADLSAAARLLHYYRLAGNHSEAQRVLATLDQAAARLNPQQQLDIARLYLAAHNATEAARRLHALFTAPNSPVAESAGAELIELLLDRAGQPFQFGSGDLSFYKDIATLDDGPGLWNGVLSLIFNATSPAAEFNQQQQFAGEYFHRAAAAELLRAFDARHPQSPRRPALHARIVAASAIHNEPAKVVQQGTQFLAAFPNADQRTRVALETAGAHAKLNQPQQEFALYDALLNELAARADRVPLGEAPGPQDALARSPEYPRVLDRYIARLTALRRLPEALTLYRREIDRNPDDPGLYERLAAFLEQNRMAGEIEDVYRRAMARFPDKSWSHKLARFFLRSRMNAKYDALSQQVTQAFSGTELESYLNATAARGSLDPVLYRQVNLYAHTRFPRHIPFVKNLLAAYTTRATSNPAEWNRLIRSYWMYDSQLSTQFFEHLSRNNLLDAELAALTPQAASEPAAALWVAEAEAWKGHFETAAPLLEKLSAAYPADAQLGARAASMFRSLGTFDAPKLDTAIAIEQRLSTAHPADTQVLTRLGEMEAERDRFPQAAAFFNRIPALALGLPESYLEATTLHWDYYQYDAALAQIANGRTRLANPSLHSYQAGAIYENKGDLAAAAREYVQGALAEGAGSQAQSRLLRVAARPAWIQPLAQALTQAPAGPNLLALRVALLESQGRRADLESLLIQAAANAGPDLLHHLQEHARRNSIAPAERAVITRRLALAAYPADKMQAIAERLRFEEAQNNAPAAAQAAETLLRDYPTSLGAVRTAVNFFDRSSQKPRAAAILLEAAKAAYPQLARNFRLEAIRKFTAAGAYAEAHREAAALLAADPLDEAALSHKAAAYAAASDDRALAAFYTETLAAISRSTLAAPVKQNRTAVLRRSLIPALVRAGSHTAAADQYIELLKQFPDDEALLRESAAHAAANAQKDRLTAYFAKAETDSPRDARWPIIRARLEHEFSDYRASLAAWNRATALRPERVDLLAARANLEQRLLLLPEAAASYRKLYDISFRNPEWLAQGAEVHARRGDYTQAFAWLKEAYVDNRPASAAGHAAVLNKLLSWNQIQSAASHWPTAWASAVTDNEFTEFAVLWSQIAIRSRQYDQLLRPLAALQHDVQARALAEAARTVALYATPEDKLRFSQLLDSLRPAWPPQELAAPAQAAGLLDKSAAFYQQALLAEPAGDNAAEWVEQLIRFQNSRLEFQQLGRQLEAYYRALPNNDRKGYVLSRAMEAYNRAGDAAAELRLASIPGAPCCERLFELLSVRTPIVLPATKAATPSMLDNMANFGFTHANPAVVNQAITGRRSVLWQNAYRALAGLYFNQQTPEVRKAFLDVLGPDRIGEKLALAGNRDIVAAGDIWFYFSHRYGALLNAAGDSNAPFHQAAFIERRPASANAYLDLGDESSGPAAEAAFRNVLTLDAHQPMALSRLGEAAVKRNDRTAAAQLFTQSLTEFNWLQANRRVPEWFWPEAKRAMESAAAAGAPDAVRDAADALLASYAKRNGAYRIRELVEGALALGPNPDQALARIVRTARSAGDPAAFLAQINQENWLPASAREPLLRRQLLLADERHQAALGEEREFSANAADEARLRLVNFLLDAKKPAEARTALEPLRTRPGINYRYDFATAAIQLAALDGTLAANPARVLDGMNNGSEFLRGIAANLQSANNAPAARALLRYANQQDLQQGNVVPALLGLAALDLEENKVPAALAALDKVTMLAPEPFTLHAEAARLLIKHNQPADAEKFLTAAVTAMPWSQSPKLQLAELRRDAQTLAAAANDPNTLYAERAQAAQWLGTNAQRSLSSPTAELNALATGPLTEQTAIQPNWTQALLAAARTQTEPNARIRLFRAYLTQQPEAQLQRAELFRLLTTANRWREAAIAIEDRTWSLPTPADMVLYADALIRTAQYDRALAILESPDPTPEQVRLTELARSHQRLLAANAQRRPVVRETLEQENLVRPVLPAPRAALLRRLTEPNAAIPSPPAALRAASSPDAAEPNAAIPTHSAPLRAASTAGTASRIRFLRVSRGPSTILSLRLSKSALAGQGAAR